MKTKTTSKPITVLNKEVRKASLSENLAIIKTQIKNGNWSVLKFWKPKWKRGFLTQPSFEVSRSQSKIIVNPALGTVNFVDEGDNVIPAHKNPQLPIRKRDEELEAFVKEASWKAK